MNSTSFKQQCTAIIEREGDSYVSLCPELDIASQGNTIEEAKQNLAEAVELFFEVADLKRVNSYPPLIFALYPNPVKSCSNF
ncbi:MAG: hypothetical protein C4288_00815 [Leptolyngbya sp. ERB_1_1]